MNYAKYVGIFMITLLVAGLNAQDGNATTDDGRRVILYNDGTWGYAPGRLQMQQGAGAQIQIENRAAQRKAVQTGVVPQNQMQNRATQRKALQPGVTRTNQIQNRNLNARNTVYVSRANKQYHLANCRRLEGARTALNLSAAKVQYTECELCFPPRNILRNKKPSNRLKRKGG